MKKTKIVILSSLAVLLVAGVVQARAQVSLEAQNQAKSVRNEARQIQTKNSKVVCTIIERRIKNRISHFNNQKDIHVASYNKTKALITEKIRKLEEAGYDVTKLKTDLLDYDVLIVQFGTDYDIYISLLTATQDYACGQAEGDFRAQLVKARAQLKVVHKDAVEIRTFWAKTIRLDFLALKKQSPKTTDDSTDETTTQNGGE